MLDIVLNAPLKIYAFFSFLIYSPIQLLGIKVGVRAIKKTFFRLISANVVFKEIFEIDKFLQDERGFE